MTVFFLVVGLEAKREFDLGELRDRRRVVIPVLAAIGGIAVPVAIYLGVNAGGPARTGGGGDVDRQRVRVGALALLTPRSATRLRVFLLTLSVVDDLCALVVIAIVYTAHVSIVALAVASACSACSWAASHRRAASPAFGRGGGRSVGGDVQVGHRSGHLGSRDRACDRRLRTLARGSGARRRVGLFVS